MPENRIVLSNRNKSEAANISGFLERGGFSALKRARTEMKPFEVIEEIKLSKLRGRGGAGFPCGAKWEMAARAPGDQKFLICNADEGELGAFKDRYILENAPYALLEGILIAGYAIGATCAYIYLRQEYSALAQALALAISEATQRGLMEKLEIHLIQGAGAYVCGEESALLESIEGKRGEPRYKPPFPAEVGLFGKPTVINNVETLLNIAPIVLNGPDWFRAMGTGQSTGTKVFSVSGDVEKPGVYEMVMGSSLRELLELAGAKEVQMVQVGGAAGRFIPAEQLDMPLCYETTLGSGAVIVMDGSRQVVEAVYLIMEFFAEESCGKCAPCREGTKALAGILKRIAEGDGIAGDVQAMEEVAETMRLSSLCGLGQSAPTALLDALQYFPDDFEKRIEQSAYLRRLRGTWPA